MWQRLGSVEEATKMGQDQPAHSGQSLNENHRRRLRITFEYIDRLLGEVENMAEAAASRAAFPRYSSDFTPPEQGLVREQVSLVRSRLTGILNSHGIPFGAERISARRAIRVSLDYMEVAAEELGAHYMRGYGSLDPQAAAQLDTISRELRGALGGLEHLLSDKSSSPEDPHEAGPERIALSNLNPLSNGKT
jgi:hypothetical protein